MLIIGSGIITGLLLISAVIFLKKYQWDSNSGWWFLLIFSAVGLLIVVIATPAVYASNAIRIAELKAFQETNIQNYSTAVNETRAILSGEEFIGKMIAGSVEKTELGKSISERVREWRDAANANNIEVVEKQKVRTLWFYPGWMIIPAEVNDLKLLTIK